MSDTTNASVGYGASGAAGDDNHRVATYLSDMLALERHIRQPLDKQYTDDDTAEYASAAAIVAKIRTLTDAHEAALTSALDAAGGDAASGVKSAWAQMIGAGAAAVNAARKTKVSKSLRDDYTALALASISYTMLYTTALGLGDTASAAIAKRHLEDYAPIVVEIGKAIPAVVLQELTADGERVKITAAEIAEQNASAAWSRS